MTTQASPRIQSRYASRRSSWVGNVIGFDSTWRSLTSRLRNCYLCADELVRHTNSTSWLPLAVRYNSGLADTRHVGPLAMLGIWATLCFGGGLYASWLGYGGRE